MTLGTFQAVKHGGSKGGLPGRAQRGGVEARCGVLEDGSGKEGEWGKADRQHRPYSYHCQ